jgi:hypothetical protein
MPTNEEITLFDILWGIGFGLALGWIVGGLWNVLQGKMFSGKDK